mmetsp:Transcript_1878/g.7536  ORF Transcript_1878/g.7536 Transcript_1878/m.7536 type:complete len:255 (+) Transcript_1878:1950-2714(+)
MTRRVPPPQAPPRAAEPLCGDAHRTDAPQSPPGGRSAGAQSLAPPGVRAAAGSCKYLARRRWPTGVYSSSPMRPWHGRARCMAACADVRDLLRRLAALTSVEARPTLDEHVGRRLRGRERPRDGRARASSRAYDAIRSKSRARGRVIVRQVRIPTCLSMPINEKTPPCVECPANSRRAFRRCLQAPTAPSMILPPLICNIKISVRFDLGERFRGIRTKNLVKMEPLRSEWNPPRRRPAAWVGGQEAPTTTVACS